MEKKKNLEQTRDGKFKIGSDIYIPTSLYLSRGRDDFDGGLCKIIKIEEFAHGTFISVKENPGSRHNYDYLLKQQEKLKEEHGNLRGKRNPDYSLDSNCWACPGDIVDGKKIDYYIP